MTPVRMDGKEINFSSGLPMQILLFPTESKTSLSVGTEKSLQCQINAI